MIPKPNICKSQKGTIELPHKLTICDLTCTSDQAVEVFKVQLETLTGLQADKLECEPATIVLKHNGPMEENKKGAYILEVKEDGIFIFANDSIGSFYGLQTLIQLIARHKASGILPCQFIEDWPAYEWRGLMFDVSRCFYPVPVIKKMIDMMALLKMNVFHWHLTDDQGWRLPVEAYPQLTSTDEHYSRAEIKEIVAYAGARAIDVVPEIDMPGHFTAAISAYNYLGCTGDPMDVPEHFGVFKTIACGGRESTYEFIEAVMDEVCDLFPFDYIHLGGDEARKDLWKRCPHCQTKIREENLGDEEGLQGYFMNRIFKYLMDVKGKKVIGWNENLHAKNLDSRLVIQHWYDGKKKKNSRQALKKGREMIVSDTAHVYFDYPYCVTPLEKVYAFNPLFDGFTESEGKSIKGIEGTVWTEFIRTVEDLEEMIYPRVFALAEVGWTEQSNRSYSDFKVRLATALDLCERTSTNYKRLEDADMKWFKARMTEHKYRRQMNKIHKRNKKLNR